jgi:hypothetical protein
MLEAWLLFDGQAIRKAAGNPNGKGKLNLPHIKKIESLPDPKNTLYQQLKQASGLNQRRLKKFDASSRVHAISENISDFSPLYGLQAFKALRKDLIQIISREGWDY